MVVAKMLNSDYEIITKHSVSHRPTSTTIWWNRRHEKEKKRSSPFSTQTKMNRTRYYKYLELKINTFRWWCFFPVYTVVFDDTVRNIQQLINYAVETKTLCEKSKFISVCMISENKCLLFKLRICGKTKASTLNVQHNPSSTLSMKNIRLLKDLCVKRELCLSLHEQ